MTKRILKSSKIKHWYEEYKNFFETITRKTKKYYYSKQIIKYKNNIKKTWEVIKEIIGKTKNINNNLSEKFFVSGKNILDKKEIANKFNNFFVKIGLKLAKKTQPSKYSFESNIKSINIELPEQTVSIKGDTHMTSTLKGVRGKE